LQASPKEYTWKARRAANEQEERARPITRGRTGLGKGRQKKRVTEYNGETKVIKMGD